MVRDGEQGVGSCEFGNDTLGYKTYLLTPWSTVLLEKLTGFHLVQKFPTFYGNRRFITAFTSARAPVPILSQLDPVHTPTSYFLKIHLNIILPSMLGFQNMNRISQVAEKLLASPNGLCSN